MNKKVNIMEVLEKVDSFDLEYFNNLTEEEKKSVSPYTLMLWMGGCKSDIQLRQLNVFFNSTVFELGTLHKELLYKLACISSDGKKKRYSWVKKKGKSKKYSTCVKILRRYYQCSTEIALSYVPLLGDEIIDIALELGEQDDTIKKIQKELK